ncbi:phosphatase PAP2 family protein [Paraburkholderia tropica]|uniref:hypothetical protein n=1 Tax=Paraburkholderia tropica TaxID=92647 RepID=UPI002AB11277|nr:hypothetical protein [Paraburkholderia tropica]
MKERHASSATPQKPLSRRRNLFKAAAATALASSLPSASLLAASVTAIPTAAGPTAGAAMLARRERARQLRIARADLHAREFVFSHPDNGDEAKYADRNYFASFSRGLPHNALGEVDPAAYRMLLKAIEIGTFEAFEAVPLGGSIKFGNPLQGYSFLLEGQDPWGFALPPAPTFESERFAAELIETYWMALTRDVPFTDYGTNRLISMACADLSKTPGYAGPREQGDVTPVTFGRAGLPGEFQGPRLSQFSLMDVPNGSLAPIQQLTIAPKADLDFMTGYDNWLSIQSGNKSTSHRVFESERRYARTARAWFEAFRNYTTFQTLINAAEIILGMGHQALDPANPYRKSRTQLPGTSFGREDIRGLLGRVWTPVDTLAGFQKWIVHRRPKPEQIGGRVHNHMLGRAHYPFHGDLFKSPVLAELHARQGSYLVSQVLPDGGGQQPSYTQSCATFLGAGVTVLKWFFNEDYVIQRPVMPDESGTHLMPCAEQLTLGNELNKLAGGAFAANFNGSHFRSDTMEGLKLGEQFALSVIADHVTLYAENFSGFSLTKFDGTKISI